MIKNVYTFCPCLKSLTEAHKKDFLILTVKDDGKGFSAADLEKATTVFSSNDKEKQHFGIGLSVCKILCEKHGGLLYVGNQKEKGACVTAKLKIF